MLRNYLAAALRNLFRNRAYAALNICGLALGFAAVILIGLYVRDEYSYDRFFPEHERIYRVQATVKVADQAPLRISVTSADIAAALELDFPQIESVTRLAVQTATLRHGDIEESRFVSWADPNFFRLFPLRTVAGDADAAVQTPDGIVLTRRAARALFGRDDVVGQTLELNRRHTMRVMAVIENLPANTHFNGDVFAPGIASFSELTALDAVGSEPGAIRRENAFTYVRLRPSARVSDVSAGLSGFAKRHLPGEFSGVPRWQIYTFSLVPLTDIHLQPRSLGDAKPSGDPRTLQAMIGIAALILFVAGSNFVSMMTARAARRAVEVGVRKAVGATRRQIIVQFLGECLFYAGLALVIAVIAVKLTLPAFNGFLLRDIALDLASDPLLDVALVTMWLVTGLAAGVYPALVLSMFRPSVVLKGVAALPGGSGRMRQALVVFQFGTLIALIVATLTIHRQTQYAIEERLRLPGDQIFLGRSTCPPAFRDAVVKIPGVRSASCASGTAMSLDRFGTTLESPSGSKVAFRVAPIDQTFFDVLTIRPLAGRLFAPDRGADNVLLAGPDVDANPSMIINETGARALGFADPQAAVNQYRRWQRVVVNLASFQFRLDTSRSSQIVGVIPDLGLGSVRDVIEPTVYYLDPSMLNMLLMRLDGGSIPATMDAVRKLWAQQGPPRPFGGVFRSQFVNDLYADILRQSALFAMFSGVAVVIAALGLLSLAVFTAERRTREIGLRKVMGASRWDILRFIAWQFTRPVLWANLFAWPAAYLVMRHWLEGFAYHIDLSPLAFVVASGLALAIALVTVAGHAMLVARTRPAAALRYE